MQLPLLGKLGKRTQWIFSLVTIGSIGIATTSYLAFRANTTKPNETEETVVVSIKNLAFEIKANGVIQAERKTNISPKEGGRIIRLFVDEGSQVKEGDLIAQMDNEQIQAQVNQYQATLNKANAELKSKQLGYQEEDIAKAVAELEKSRAQAVEAQSRLIAAIRQRRRKQRAFSRGGIARQTLEEALGQESTARDTVETMKASVVSAQQELAKLQQGHRPEEIAQAKAGVDEAIAQLQNYQAKLTDTIVKAPFDGVITRRFAQKGDYVTPQTSASSSDGATSASIAELSRGLEVEAKVPEASMAQIKPGQEVEIRSDSHADHIFRGKVRLVSPRAIQENSQPSSSGGNVTSFRVKVTLLTGQENLKIGMNVRLTFIGDQIQNALVIPLSAIATQQDGQTGVFIAAPGHESRFQPVKVGAKSGNQVQILQGLKRGDRVLLTPPDEPDASGVASPLF
jgi:HlyD family secretion protein